MIMGMSSCSKSDGGGGDDPVLPTVTKKYILWVDATSNFPRLSNSQDSIRKYVTKAKECGFTDLVVDVRPITGEVLYNSTKFPIFRSWYKNGTTFTRTATFDYLKAFVDIAAQIKGINIYAGMNTFVGGHLYTPYCNENREIIAKTHPEWISQSYVWDGSSAKIISAWDFYKGKNVKPAAFLNPGNTEVQDYLLSIIDEITSTFAVKGVVLDRGRHDNIESDFSDVTRDAFQKYIGESIVNFPEDIYKRTGSSTTSITQGKWYKKWLEYRASVIYGFFSKAKSHAKANGKEFVAYVGAWYGSYYNEGVNWASKTYDPSKTYSWATPEYKNYGYAELLDFIMTGCYSSNVSTVQGYITTSKTVINGAIPVAASLNVEDFTTLDKASAGSGLTAFQNCLVTAARGTGNVMVFDMVHMNNDLYNPTTTKKYWDVVKSVFAK